MHKLPVGVLGASGYTGRELVALVARHPRLSLRFAAAHQRAGETVRVGADQVTFCTADDAPLGDVALVFTALPHGASAAWVERARASGAKVVDLANDLRPGSGESSMLPSGRVVERKAEIRDANGGTEPHLRMSNLALSASPIPYGLTEVARAHVAGADVVANPGCYPTAILLALLPFVEAGLVAPDGTVSVSAASGVTGAGNSPKPELLFGEVTENFRAYGVGNGHKHLDEMRAVLGDAGLRADLLFTPHLLPVARGILATITLPLVRDVDPRAVLAERWGGERFIEVADAPPALRDVVHRNVARVYGARMAGTRRPTVVLMAAIDNLLKGAAGQAMQNANLMLGLDEALGLPA